MDLLAAQKRLRTEAEAAARHTAELAQQLETAYSYIQARFQTSSLILCQNASVLDHKACTALPSACLPVPLPHCCAACKGYLLKGLWERRG